MNIPVEAQLEGQLHHLFPTRAAATWPNALKGLQLGLAVVLFVWLFSHLMLGIALAHVRPAELNAIVIGPVVGALLGALAGKVRRRRELVLPLLSFGGYLVAAYAVVGLTFLVDVHAGPHHWSPPLLAYPWLITFWVIGAAPVTLGPVYGAGLLLERWTRPERSSLTAGSSSQSIV